MVFSSITFIFVFLPALILLYFACPHKYRNIRNMILLLFSLMFYGYSGIKYLALMLVSITVNYLGGLLSSKDRNSAYRKIAIICTVICNIGMLAWFKYTGFVVSNLNAIGMQISFPEIVLPVGISFYTFQGLSYALDVYRGDAPVERSILRVALYVSLFPQLVAGPIVRYTTIADEIQNRLESEEDVGSGVIRFLFGLSKKVLLANQLGQIADAAFSTPSAELSIAFSWLGMIAYGLQIYFDFSAYSDMAIGLGRVFGFHFLENFNYPYIAKSITDFWHRWHISLSTWFRDYLYFPLGGNRCRIRRQIVNLLIVWGLTGLWHGAAWNFLLWGLYFACLLIGERYIWGRLLQRMPTVLQHSYALILVFIGWVLFRSPGLKGVLDYFSAMFTCQSGVVTGNAFIYHIIEYRWELLVSIVAVLPVKNFLSGKLKKRDTRWALWVQSWGVAVVALVLGGLSIVRLVSSNFNPFIYFQF